MTTWLAVLALGAGSFALRVAPLLTTRHLPDRLTAAAGAGGLSVLVGFSARSVLEYADPGTPYAVLVAAVSVGIGLVVAFRGRGVLASIAVGLAAYLALAMAAGAGR
jgi:branched-subunit amino acid transport protein